MKVVRDGCKQDTGKSSIRQLELEGWFPVYRTAVVVQGISEQDIEDIYTIRK